MNVEPDGQKADNDRSCDDTDDSGIVVDRVTGRIISRKKYREEIQEAMEKVYSTLHIDEDM